MIENNSWIKVFRKFREWEWYQDSNTKSVFLELLLTANYEDKRWQGIVVKRGQIITSINHLKIALNKNPKNPAITTQNIRTSLKRLKSTNELTIQTTTKYTLISINKYNDYQQVTNKLTNNQQTTNKQLTTTKEVKKRRSKDITTRTSKKTYIVKGKKYTLNQIGKKVLEAFNLINETNYSSLRPFIGNLEKCLIDHTPLKILEALNQIPYDPFWGKINTSPEKIFRQSKDGQPKDYIEDLLNSKKKNHDKNRGNHRND